MEPLISLQNPRVKQAVKLQDRRERRKQGRFLLDGLRELRRALAAGVRPREAFVCPEQCDSRAVQDILDTLQQAGCQLFEVTEPLMARLAYGERSEGIVAVAEVRSANLDKIRLPENPLVAVLERVEKPGNIGAVLRSADAAGVAALVLADCGTDLYNPNTIRASLGTLFTVPVAVASAEETLYWLREQKLAIYAARVDGARDYTSADLRLGTAIVLGAEAEGLTSLWNVPDVTPVRLPMLGQADSLNVSVTAAVLFYEALRQRSSAP